MVAVSLLLLAGPAQGQGARDHVRWQATAPQAVQPGDTVQLQLRAQIESGWKMYAMDSPPPSQGVTIQLDTLPDPFQAVGSWQQATPQEGYDPNFDKTVRYFAGEASFRRALKVADEAAAGSYDLEGQVRFMICTDRLCLPPTPAPFSVQVAVGEEAASSAQGNAEQASPEQDFTGGTPPLGENAGQDTVAESPARADSALTFAPVQQGGGGSAGGLWAFLLLAAGAGAAALLTPCVFPMIPLTVSYFTKHGGSRSQSARLALVYGGAIVTTFTGLGVLTALFVGAAGAQSIAANPWVNLLIGAVFVVFALSLLGLFELRLPSGLLNYFNRQSSERAGYAGVLFMGLTLTLVSFSCTAPFVGGLLATAAQGSWRDPVLGMLVFSLVFSLPFVAFALFPNALQSLPRSGSWMRAVKVTLGFVELAAALKFLSNADLIWGWGLISRPLAIALTVVIFFLAGMYLLGKLPLKHEPAAERIGVGRLLAAIGFFGLALYLLPGLLGAPLGRIDAYLPPRQASDVHLSAVASGEQGGSVHAMRWHEEIDPAFAAAREQEKPVFVDFTGYTCTNCREMEANVFPEPEVARRFQSDFVLLRLYTDAQDGGEAFQQYQLDLTGTVALPTYAVVSPHAKDALLAKHSGVATAKEFVDFLDRGTEQFEQRALALR